MIEWLLNVEGFMPRRFCGPAWTPELVQTSLFCNQAIFACYVYLAGAALAMWRLRLRLSSSAGWLCFLFILSCGFTHWTQALMFTRPAYRLDVAGQIVCATFSLATVAYLSASAAWQLVQRRKAQQRGC